MNPNASYKQMSNRKAPDDGAFVEQSRRNRTQPAANPVVISSATETSPGPAVVMARSYAFTRAPHEVLKTMLSLYNVCIVVQWEIEYTDEFETWWERLTEEEQEAIDAAIEILEERGPRLGRPLADNVHQSRHPNMKELRPATSIRVLFAFDPRRVAILLIGGERRD